MVAIFAAAALHQLILGENYMVVAENKCNGILVCLKSKMFFFVSFFGSE